METKESGELVTDQQLKQWESDLATLASQIALARGKQCAVVVITPAIEDYEDTCPQLIVEDALCVGERGWPDSFDFDILNA